MRLLSFALLSLILLMPIALSEIISTYTIPPKLTAAETQDAPTLSEATVWQVFATAGFAGGLVYWIIAGRNA